MAEMIQSISLAASAWVEDAEAQLFTQNIKNDNITASTRVDLYIDKTTIDNLREAKVSYMYTKNGCSAAVKNMLPSPSSDSWDLQDVTVEQNDTYGAVFAFGTGTTAMAYCPLGPVSPGHLYYGRVMYWTEAGFESGDGRFEFYYTDGDNGTMVFSQAISATADGAAHTDSAILAVAEDVSGGANWNLRNFVVDATKTLYRTQPILIDLTAMFGQGEEPTKEWCDANIDYFTGVNDVSAGEGWVTVVCVDQKPTANLRMEANLVDVVITE